jgi:phage-related protein
MSWTWELYQDNNGDIPKDLLAFFVGLMPEGEKSPDLPESVLTPAESKRLQVNLGYLCDRGLASLTSGIFEKLEDDLYELRMTKSTHNPRFVVTTLVPQRFVILHAFMKKYDGGIRDRDLLPARQRLQDLTNR